MFKGAADFLSHSERFNMALRPYPTSLDMAIWQEMLAVIEGAKKPDAHSIHCLEDGVAFGLGQAFPDPATGVLAAGSPHSGPAMTHAQAADVCRKMIGAKGLATAHASAVPAGMSWLQWVQLILGILQGLGPVIGGVGGAGS
jgi:hypothetical protein